MYRDAAPVPLGGEASEGAPSSPEPTRSELSAAVRRGWRVAELYALADDAEEPPQETDTLLPAHESMPPGDQLELQLHAAAGDARRAGMASSGALLERLVPLAHDAPSSPRRTNQFRDEVAGCHIELSKGLWARDEAAGKAYELGNGMSDTYSRICRAYRGEDGGNPEQAWKDVFEFGRVERLKKLLDDLESRLDSAGVAVVRHHLDTWCKSVADWAKAGGDLPDERVVLEQLRRQTVIWRQLMAGDKSPEAYLDRVARAELRGDLRRLVWSKAKRWILPGAAALFAVAVFLPEVRSWYHANDFGQGIVSAVVAVAGALGITTASIVVTARTQAHRWSELLWNRAVAHKVSDTTLLVGSIFSQPVRGPRSVGQVAARLAGIPAAALRGRRHLRMFPTRPAA